METMEIAIVFDGSPGPQAPRFIETERSNGYCATGEGVGVGRWVDNRDGTWALLIRVPSEDVRTGT
jgi:hypothetical protein